MWDCINLHSCQSDVLFFIFDTLPCIFCKPKFLLNKVKISGLCRHFLQMMTIWVFKQGTRIYSETQWSNKTFFRWLTNDRRIVCVYGTKHLGKLAGKAKLFTIKISPPSHFSIGEKTQEIHCKASSSERNSDRRVHGGENRELISN